MSSEQKTEQLNLFFVCLGITEKLFLHFAIFPNFPSLHAIFPKSKDPVPFQ